MLRVRKLLGGHAATVAQYPFLENIPYIDRLPCYPCHVQPCLFIGSSLVASSKKALDDLQIQAVLNTAVEHPNYHDGTHISYLKLPFVDDDDQSLVDGLPEAFSFLE